MTVLQIALLGNVEIYLDNIPLKDPIYKKSLALLNYLALTGHPHSRESLSGLLWGETSEANARAGLRKSLADLRDLVGEHIITERQHVSFNLDAPYSLDVTAFEDKIAQFQGCNGSELTPEEANALAIALDTYRGDFLSGFHVRRAKAFEEWVAVQRERLKLDAIQGLRLLADHYLTQGNYYLSTQCVERLLVFDPYHEEAHRQMMSLLALDGRREAALRQYQILSRLLDRTLKIKPQPETTNLYRHIRQQSPAHPKKQKSNQRVPIPLTPLIGRETELSEIETLLVNSACRLLTIIGPGGSGKTHLASAVIEHLLQSNGKLFADGITFIPLNALKSLSNLPAALMHYLNFHFHSDRPLLLQLEEQLAARKCLIVLDNFEHLLATPSDENGAELEEGLSMLTRLLQSAPGVKMLATSRARLNIEGEYIFPLQGFDIPSNGENKTASALDIPAIELFIQRARQVDPNFNADLTSDRLAIAKICRQVGGLPLGILLAAGWSGILSPADITAQLSSANGVDENQLDLLISDQGSIPTRHRSLRNVFNYSWNLLTDREQTALAALSIFPAGSTLDAAREISDVRLIELRTLLGHSLIQRGSSGRYQLHEVTRQYAQENISNADTLYKRYTTYYAAQLHQWATQIKSADQMEAIITMDHEIDNARKAWELVVEQGDKELIEQSIDGLCMYYDWRYRYPEGYIACEILVNWLEEAQSPAPIMNWNRSDRNRLLARALAWQSVFAPGKDKEALLHRALAYLEDPTTDSTAARPELAFCLGHMGQSNSYIDDSPMLIDSCRRSMALFEALGDKWGIANVCKNLGSILWDNTFYAESAQVLQKGLDLYQALGDRKGAAATMMRLGNVSMFLGQTEGEGLIYESLALFDDLGDRGFNMMEGFYNAIIAMIGMGRFKEANALLLEQYNLDKDNGVRQEMSHTLLADTFIFLGQYNQARYHAEVGLELSQHSGDPSVMGYFMVPSGWLALADGDFALAGERFEKAVRYCREHDVKEPLSWALAFRGYVWHHQGQSQKAAGSISEALQMAAENKSYVGILIALVCSIPLLADCCSPELGLSCHAAIIHYPLISNSPFFIELIDKKITSLRKELPPEVVKRAKAHGQSQELDAVVAEVLTALTAVS